MSEKQPAVIVRECLRRMLARIVVAEEELGRLDAAAGDGDHGAGMVRGMRSAVAAVDQCEPNTSAGDLLMAAGGAFADDAGGASGALFGALFSTAGEQIGNDPLTATRVAGALSAALQMVSMLGKAEPGDKTLIDTLDPFVRAMTQAAADGLSLRDAWQHALPVAEAGALSTADMVARRGRSSRLGERSRGHPDPGAISMLYLLQAALPDQALSENRPALSR